MSNIPFDPSKFTAPKAKPLPVVLLLDVSGSMSGEKIRNVNDAVRDMLNTFSGCEQLEEILVSDKWSVCWGIEDGDRTFDGAKKLPNYNHVTTGADKGYDNRCGGYLTFK